MKIHIPTAGYPVYAFFPEWVVFSFWLILAVLGMLGQYMWFRGWLSILAS